MYCKKFYEIYPWIGKNKSKNRHHLCENFSELVMQHHKVHHRLSIKETILASKKQSEKQQKSDNTEHNTDHGIVIFLYKKYIR